MKFFINNNRFTIVICLIFSSFSCSQKNYPIVEVIDDTFMEIVDTLGYTQNTLLYIPECKNMKIGNRSILISPKLHPLDSLVTGLSTNLQNDSNYIEFNNFLDNEIKSFNITKIYNHGRYILGQFPEIANYSLKSINLGNIKYSKLYFTVKKDKVLFAIKLSSENNYKVRIIVAKRNRLKWVVIQDEQIETT